MKKKDAAPQWVKQRWLFLSLMTGTACVSAAEVSDDQAARQQQRIIALAPHIVEQLYAIGAGDQIIGTTAYADYPEAAKQIPGVGSYAGLQIEKIIQMQPDVIIAWKTGNPVEDLQRLEQYQLKVVYSDLTRLEDVARELRTFGKLTGRQAAAESQAVAYEQRLGALRQTYADKAPLTAFYELWSQPLTTVAGTAWPQQQIELCGVHNPFQDAIDDYPHVGLEQVLVTNPQVIIQPSKHSQDSPDAVEWEKWPSLPAVQHSAIFHPDADKVHRMTSRTLDEVEVLCQQIDDARQRYRVKTSAK